MGAEVLHLGLWAVLAPLLAAADPGQEEEAREDPPVPEARPGLLDTLRDLSSAGIQAGEGGPVLHFGGTFATDLVLWDRRNERHSGPEGGTARIRMEISRGEDLRLLVEGDLPGEDAPDRLLQAWGEWGASGSLRIRAGLMKVALGTEFATPEEDLPLVGRSFTSWLDGRHDLALRAGGTLAGEGVCYEATWAAGHGFGLDGRSRTSSQESLRLVLHPFRLAGKSREGGDDFLDGLFLGAGLARLGDFEDPVHLGTPLGNTVFETPDLDGDGGRWVHLEIGAASGPWSGGLEVVRGEARDVRGPGGTGETVDEITAFTWTLAASLTGERRGWKDGRWTREPPRSRWGAWEVAVRYSNGDIDRNLFRAGWTTYDPSAQEVRTFSVLLGWRPTEEVRVALGWVKTISDDSLTVFGGGGPSPTPRRRGGNRDSSFVLRLEVGF